MTARHRTNACVAGFALWAALVASVASTGQAAGARSGDAELNRQMAEVRRATAKYHQLEVAVADGYVPFGDPLPCVENPGVGTMGYHYYNPQLLHDGVLDPTRPELLVYAPSGNGVRLGAVEYMMPVSTWSGSEAPDIFGKPFDGPMAEHEPGTSGVHYDQHAWVWAHNPDGVLATWNPAVEC
jgi:hypothetical protein